MEYGEGLRMNKVIISGRTTKEPEIRYTDNNKAVAKFTLAIKNPFNNEKADFINCVAWGKLAELLEKHGFKGQQLALDERKTL